MAMQDALGPVFAYEWLRASRRWQLYAIRLGFVGAILGGLLILWSTWSTGPQSSAGMDLRRMAAFGESVYSTIVTIELTLILFAAPAATAGAVCLDKSRGTLVHVMATDLRDSEIVLGKLAAGLLPVVGLVFCLLPVLMLASLLGGTDPVTLFGSCEIALGTAILACTLAFALSVWGRKTHEVLSATYLLLLFWVAVTPGIGLFIRAVGISRPGWLDDVLHAVLWTNPYWLAGPSYNEPPSAHLIRVSFYLSGCLAISILLAAATVWGIRHATIHQNGLSLREARGGETKRRRLPALFPKPSLDANPVLWREWSRMRPSRWSRLTWTAYATIALAMTWAAFMDLQRRPSGGEFSIFTIMYLVSVGLLLLSVRAATSLSEERVRGSLDVLLTTPLSTPSILAGKWWGTFRLVPYLAMLPALLGAACGWEGGYWGRYIGLIMLILGYGAAVTSTGLALSVWVVRQGRVLALSVGSYVAICIGWVVIAVLLPSSPDELGTMFAMGSPLYGPVFGMIGLLGGRFSGPPGMHQAIPAWLVIWNVVYWTLAAVLFWAACLTFDRCLGRMPAVGAYEPAEDGLWSLVPRFSRGSRDASNPGRGATEPA